jgi:hypothetical protein
VALDGDPKAMGFIKPNLLDRPGFPVGEYDGFSDELGLRVLERAEYR